MSVGMLTLGQAHLNSGFPSPYLLFFSDTHCAILGLQHKLPQQTQNNNNYYTSDDHTSTPPCITHTSIIHNEVLNGPHPPPRRPGISTSESVPPFLQSVYHAHKHIYTTTHC